MRFSHTIGMATLALVTGLVACDAPNESSDANADAGAASSADRLNGMIALQAQNEPVFGLYAPRARTGRGRAGGAAPEGPAKTPTELATETLAYASSDFVFDGSMERSVDEALPAFSDFVGAMQAGGADTRSNPLVVKMQEIGTDYDGARDAIGKQLDAGVSTIMFVKVESAEEVRQGLAAMRFASNGGTRPDPVGAAPAYWGVSEAEYRQKADLWPLNPEGELLNWTIVESHEGLANVREIAAVEGIGVLWPGAGTLRRLFSPTNAGGERVLDEEAWENSIQTVLSACKEFDVACGYPSNASDIEMRMEQGFSVFVMGWGDSGFETVDLGRQLSRR